MSLDSRQQLALNVLINGGTGADAAKTAGVSPQLISRWKKLPEFQQAFINKQAGVLNELVAKMAPLVDQAVKAVKTCLTRGHGQIRLRAAELIFNQLHKGIEATDLLNRIQELEQALNEALSAAGPPEQNQQRDSSPTGQIPESPARSNGQILGPTLPDEGISACA